MTVCRRHPRFAPAAAPFALAVVVAWALSGAAWGVPGMGAGAADDPVADQPAAPEMPEPLRGIEIIQKLESQVPLDLTFYDESGAAVRLGDYFREGRPVVLNLVYHDCPMLCGLVMNGLLMALGEMDWTPGERFAIVTVSINPAETPEFAGQVKDGYLHRYGREGAGEAWHFLTTPDESTIRALADAVGFGYRWVESQQEWAHPAAHIVLTPDGRVSRYLEGVMPEGDVMRLSLVEASDGGIGSLLDRMFLRCFQYDPDTGRYVASAVALMRVGGGLTVLVLAGVLGMAFFREHRRRRRSAG